MSLHKFLKVAPQVSERAGQRTEEPQLSNPSFDITLPTYCWEQNPRILAQTPRILSQSPALSISPLSDDHVIMTEQHLPSFWIKHVFPPCMPLNQTSSSAPAATGPWLKIGPSVVFISSLAWSSQEAREILPGIGEVWTMSVRSC